MLLLSPLEAATAIGAKCGGATMTQENEQMLSILNYITPRVEAALNVYSLTRQAHTERFEPVGGDYTRSSNDIRPRIKVRLSNGFLVANSIVVTDPMGEVVDLESYADIDREYGIITLADWNAGIYRVTYESGFVPGAVAQGIDSDLAVLEEVPTWMKAIAIDLLVLWYRAIFIAPKGSKDLSHRVLMESLHREIYARLFSRYSRPRLGHVFAEKR